MTRKVKSKKRTGKESRQESDALEPEVVIEQDEEDDLFIDRQDHDDNTIVIDLEDGADNSDQDLHVDHPVVVDSEKSQPLKPSRRPARESLAPARYDSLSAYLNEIGRHPMLSKEQEMELAKRYLEDKDLEAAYRLVVSNLWLVVKIARDYERAARNLLDVIQEGNIGLMEAVKNFDPYRGVRFPSYAVWWIKAYILRFVIANWRLVKIGTTQAQRKLFFNLKKEKERLEREGFTVGPKLLAEKLQVKESDILEMEQRLSAPDLSVHTPLGQDSDLDVLSTLPAAQLNAEDALQKKEMQNLISESFEAFAKTLNERDRIIFEERLLGEEKVTLHDLAERFSLSKERVRQLENRVRDKLKQFLLEKMGEKIEESFELSDQE